MPLPALAVAYLRNQLINELKSRLPQDAQTALSFISSPVQTAVNEVGKKVEESYGLPYGLSKIVTDPKSLATDFAKTKALDAIRDTESDSKIEKILKELQATSETPTGEANPQTSYMPDATTPDNTQTASLDSLFQPQEAQTASWDDIFNLMPQTNATPVAQTGTQSPVDFGGTMNYGDLFDMGGGKGFEREPDAGSSDVWDGGGGKYMAYAKGGQIYGGRR